MKIERRNFIKLGLLQAAALGLTRKANAYQIPKILRRSGPSILQGATDDTKTQFSIVHNNTEILDIYAVDSGGRRRIPDFTRTVAFRDHTKKITKVYFSFLDVNETYELHLVNAVTRELLDQREFQTLDLSKPDLSFALCSCMNDREHAPEIWQNMVQKKPDVLLFIGDSVYADSDSPLTGADPAHLWNRFCEARHTLEIYYSRRLIPIFATWDDHDFGLNDTNSVDFKFVKESQENFLNFFAQDTSHCHILEKGPGIASALKFSNQTILLLDDRSFRQRRGSKDRYAHWGKEQETWIFEKIRENPGTTWLMNGSQFFPNVPWKESVSGDHPDNFKGFLQELKLIPRKVIFASGDVHYSEISKIEKEALGYETFELTSSSIHSRNIPGSPDIIPNNRRIAGNGQRNYLLVKAAASNGGCTMDVTSFGVAGDARFQMSLQV
ncbi:hypothetical protein ACLWBD_05885 [Bdellovibrio sp. HCB117]|uniref:hypothetical protein n=1 Tax=Bdellovibrio sp. HCB117 TaxID=3394359 RepID=UPI0039B3E75D